MKSKFDLKNFIWFKQMITSSKQKNYPSKQTVFLFLYTDFYILKDVNIWDYNHCLFLRQFKWKGFFFCLFVWMVGSSLITVYVNRQVLKSCLFDGVLSPLPFFLSWNGNFCEGRNNSFIKKPLVVFKIKYIRVQGGKKSNTLILPSP